MLPWEASNDWSTDVAREFAAIWRNFPKVVFSRTLTSVVDGRVVYLRHRRVS